MSEEDDKIKKAAAEAAALALTSKEWLDKLKVANDAAPFVRRTMDQSLILSDAIKEISFATPGIDLAAFSNDFANTKGLFSSDAFKMPINPYPVAVTGSASVSAISNTFVVFASVSAFSPDITTRNWAAKVLPQLQNFQTEEANLDFVRKQLRKLNATFDQEFDLSISEYQKCRTGLVTHNAAGVAIRNVLDRLNGRLLQLARQYDSRAKVKKWEDAAQIIARGAPSSFQVAQLINQKAIFDDLYGLKLSGMLKNTVPPTMSEWDTIYSEYIGLLYTVLGLVDFRDGS
jgi:hypothetical protein